MKIEIRMFQNLLVICGYWQDRLIDIEGEDFYIDNTNERYSGFEKISTFIGYL